MEILHGQVYHWSAINRIPTADGAAPKLWGITDDELKAIQEALAANESTDYADDADD